MGVRVRVGIKYRDRYVVTAALLNSGYETSEPEIHIPLALARRLGFSLEGLRSERYSVVGTEVTTYVLGYVQVRVEAGDRVTDWVRARAVMVPGEYEVLLSDSLIEALNIQIVKPRQGVWKFVDEEKQRLSVEPMYWME